MTDHSPIIESAAKAMFTRCLIGHSWEKEPEGHKAGWRLDARDALASLAQHRDDIAQVMNQQDGAYQGRVSPSWEGLSEAGKAFYRSQVDAVLAFITGNES
jgi:hypothetical protein